MLSNEVVVKAERPLVKVEDGRLGYNLTALAESHVVNNAYEALTRLPGIQEDRGTFDFGGSRKSDCNLEWEAYNDGCRAT